jgi:hypothetical protein
MSEEIKTGFFKMVDLAQKQDRSVPQFSDLLGKTLVRVDRIDDERIEFETIDGRTFVLQHHQDCCENVEIESIAGDLSDLVGVPILLAEEAESDQTPADYKQDYKPESQTWTFYKLRTIKGSVDIRWHGTSNGCYSESVCFDEIRR